MPYYDSPSFYIDFSQLPPPAVIETIAYEDILATYKAQVLGKNSGLAKALGLEQSATNIILQAEAYGEMMVRARINAAARAVMLPFAKGTDLDVLAAFYNVGRLKNADGTDELDDRFRLRVQMAPEAFTTAGSEGAYVFHAMSAAPSILGASAVKANDRGRIKISLINTAASPAALDEQINAVAIRLNQKNIKPLTDVPQVASATILTTTIDATLTMFPGPDANIVLANVQAALTKLRINATQIGRALTRSSLITALSQDGVEDVVLASPTQDFLTAGDQCVFIAGAKVTVAKNRRL